MVAALLVALAPAGGDAMAQGRVTFASPQEAFENGIGAYRAGHLELAIPALEAAAAKNMFFAQFYLARIYSDNSTPYTDHPKAYALYQRIADEYADVDPDDDQRAPFVAKSFVALSQYLQTGLPQIGQKPDYVRAMELARHAARFFNDDDAQFELARLQLRSEASTQDTPSAIHYLTVLTEKGHASAQALLADLYWRGKFVKSDAALALSLINVAVVNAPARERIWIEDIYQNIFCGAPKDVRAQAEGRVAGWADKFSRKSETIDRSGLATLAPRPLRTCANGEPVRPIRSMEAKAAPASKPAVAGESRTVMKPSVVEGNSAGFGLRDIGATLVPRQP